MKHCIAFAKLIFITLTIHLLSTTPTLSAQPIDSRTLLSKVGPIVFKTIAFSSSNEILNTGNGFQTGPFTMISSRHLYKGAEKAMYSDGRSTPSFLFNVTADLESADLIQFRVDKFRSVPPKLSISSQVPKAGEILFIIGFKGESPLAVYQGKVITSGGKNAKGILLDFVFDPTLVGSPVFNEKGELVGVVRDNKGLNATLVSTIQSAQAMKTYEPISLSDLK